jgi:hypothetical protein
MAEPSEEFQYVRALLTCLNIHYFRSPLITYWGTLVPLEMIFYAHSFKMPINYAYLQVDYLHLRENMAFSLCTYTGLIAAFAPRSAVIHVESAVLHVVKFVMKIFFVSRDTFCTP